MLGCSQNLSNYANIFPDFDCSKHFSFRSLTFFCLLNFSIIQIFNTLTKFEISNRMGVPVMLIPRFIHHASKYDYSNGFSFRDLTFFVIFSKFSIRKRLKKTSENLKLAALWCGAGRILSWVPSLAPNFVLANYVPNFFSNHFSVRDMMFFMNFDKIIFKKIS